VGEALSPAMNEREERFVDTFAAGGKGCLIPGKGGGKAVPGVDCIFAGENWKNRGEDIRRKRRNLRGIGIFRSGFKNFRASGDKRRDGRGTLSFGLKGIGEQRKGD